MAVANNPFGLLSTYGLSAVARLWYESGCSSVPKYADAPEHVKTTMEMSVAMYILCLRQARCLAKELIELIWSRLVGFGSLVGSAVN